MKPLDQGVLSSTPPTRPSVSHNTLHAVCLFDLELVKKCADSSAAQRADKGVRAVVSRRRYSTVAVGGDVVAVDGDVVAVDGGGVAVDGGGSRCWRGWCRCWRGWCRCRRGCCRCRRRWCRC